ncbi:MAG: NirD/YgiW/YdeI family stress tolerance protein [Prolixibacteraceae bacterium]|nr:NirD/YgiW/YdeI family stress tolerance protein [Prolixibacteraceae bacterium]
MKQLSKMLMAGLILMIAGTVQAQYKGPGANNKSFTVKEVTQQASKLDRSDTLVKLQGFIVQQINGDTYWFQDATGKIKIEIEKNDLPAEPFDEKSEVIITGEVDYDLLEGTEIEVEHIEIKTS